MKEISTNSSSPSRLLWSSPRSDGFNNQLISVYIAIACAHHLNRTLVLPDLYENVRYDTKRQGPFPFSNYFNLSQLSKVVNITTPSTFRLLETPKQPCDQIYYTEMKRMPSILAHYGRTYGIKLENVSREDPSVMEKVRKEGECIDDSLCPMEAEDVLGPYSRYNETGNGFVMRLSPFFQRIRTAIVPHTNISQLADHWHSEIRWKFNAMHVRRGDYSSKCFTGPIKMLCERYGPDSAFQSNASLRSAISKFRQNKLPVFISTTNREECQQLLTGIRNRIWYLEDFKIPPPLNWTKYRTDVLALASQILASRSEQFIGNRYSSYTSEINNMRYIRNKSVERLYF